VPFPALNRFLYTEVGRDYYWTDRLVWDDARWWAWVNRPEQQTWIGYVQGTPAGYFELEAQEGGTVELAYFGLLSPFIGQGLGGALLTEAIRQAWAFAPHQPCQRVCVDTCTLDHPSALGNYQARGFQIYRTKSGQRRLHAAQS
jgi:GNAT superfamily N-acetyltransferase